MKRARRDRARCLWSTLLAAAAARAEKPPIVFPQGSEQPLAALQDIDVIEHLGDRVAGELAFTDGAGEPGAARIAARTAASRCW